MNCRGVRLTNYASEWREKWACKCDVIDIEFVDKPSQHIVSSSLSADRYRGGLPQLWSAVVDAAHSFSRPARNIIVPLLIGLVTAHLPSAADVYRQFYERESKHRQLVRQVMRHSLGVAKCRHDHTKDAYYVFMTCGKFEVGDSSKVFVDDLQTELSRHFTLEPHHPEHEKLTGQECQPIDIQEMAVDRLSRNVVANDGHIDWTQMTNFAPQFSIGDVNDKRSMFLQQAVKLEQTVIQAYLAQQQQQQQHQSTANHDDCCVRKAKEQNDDDDDDDEDVMDLPNTGEHSSSSSSPSSFIHSLTLLSPDRVKVTISVAE